MGSDFMSLFNNTDAQNLVNTLFGAAGKQYLQKLSGVDLNQITSPVGIFNYIKNNAGEISDDEHTFLTQAEALAKDDVNGFVNALREGRLYLPQLGDKQSQVLNIASQEGLARLQLKPEELQQIGNSLLQVQSGQRSIFDILSEYKWWAVVVVIFGLVAWSLYRLVKSRFALIVGAYVVAKDFIDTIIDMVSGKDKKSVEAVAAICQGDCDTNSKVIKQELADKVTDKLTTARSAVFGGLLSPTSSNSTVVPTRTEVVHGTSDSVRTRQLSSSNGMVAVAEDSVSRQHRVVTTKRTIGLEDMPSFEHMRHKLNLNTNEMLFVLNGQFSPLVEKLIMDGVRWPKV